ncbi:MAG: DUF1622 domain-containing protein [Candidatus Bathyarchaeota archaeon]|nr:DUF1622 domain-containing protein [Candidatus Bathyarchaeota archaeon]
MAECTVPTRKGKDHLTVLILLLLAAISLIGTYLTLAIPDFGLWFLPGDVPYVAGGIVYEVIYVLLTIATDILYLLGGGVIAFGAVLVAYRFLQCKLKSPYQPSCVTRFLSGYLTLSLELFIGAEIIKTVVVRTYEEFVLLILVIFSRGLFSLILYLERRWHGSDAETE